MNIISSVIVEFMSCIFCQIISGKALSTVLYQDDFVMAIKPKEQVTKNHTIVIPKQHYENIFDIDENILCKIINTCKILSKSFLDSRQASGINLLNANGIDSQQSVFHFHFHIVPRTKSDGLDMWIKQGL